MPQVTFLLKFYINLLNFKKIRNEIIVVTKFSRKSFDLELTLWDIV